MLTLSCRPSADPIEPVQVFVVHKCPRVSLHSFLPASPAHCIIPPPPPDTSSQFHADFLILLSGASETSNHSLSFDKVLPVVSPHLRKCSLQSCGRTGRPISHLKANHLSIVIRCKVLFKSLWIYSNLGKIEEPLKGNETEKYLYFFLKNAHKLFMNKINFLLLSRFVSVRRHIMKW